MDIRNKWFPAILRGILAVAGIGAPACTTTGASQVPPRYGSRVSSEIGEFVASAGSFVYQDHIAPGDGQACWEIWTFAFSNETDIAAGFMFDEPLDVGTTADVQPGLYDDDDPGSLRLIFGTPDAGVYYGVREGTVTITAADDDHVVLELQGSWLCPLEVLFPNHDQYDSEACYEASQPVVIEVTPQQGGVMELTPDATQVGTGEEGMPCAGTEPATDDV